MRDEPLPEWRPVLVRVFIDGEPAGYVCWQWRELTPAEYVKPLEKPDA